ncbi:hypothetical protein R4P64_18780 [Rhodococcus sp. IEGM 1366]|uniref:DUF6928 family protein n=1 Tax=Rhodococcus sp. IEGM 1366 TaxID=3082223 RepID=UPI002953D328|nr:hypothetical protein [Rhodococcus sp. IEGM 1366]MDV8068566.1 hypothetical protein [Rhodococcus sp. IEGM 1366]
MAARVSTIWFVDNNDVRAELSLYPQPDQAAALAIAQRLHPGKEFESLGPHPLSIAATVQPGYLFIGTYENISVVASAELSACLPSELPESWLLSPHAPLTFLVSSSPDRAQGSFAIWENGQLRRSFSALPIDIVENIGIPQTWELPYWSGKHPLRYPPGILPDPQALPFHPQQFAEAANAEWLGFRYTGAPHEGDLDKTQILLWGFKIHQKSEAPKATVPTTEQPEQAQQAQQAKPKPPAPEPVEIPLSAPTPVPPAKPVAVAPEPDPPITEPKAREPKPPTPVAPEPPRPDFTDAPEVPRAPIPEAPIPEAPTPEPKKRSRLARYFGFH